MADTAIKLYTTDIVPQMTMGDIFSDMPSDTVAGQVSQANGNVQQDQILIGGSIQKASYRSAYNNARVEIFPDYDKTIGLVTYASDDTVVFETFVAGANSGDVVIGNYAGGQGAKWDQSAGTFSIKGGLSASSLDIPDTVTANSFHVDVLGNTWWGSTVIGSAVAKVLNTGYATFTAVTISGGSLVTFISDTIDTSSKYILKDFVFSPSDYSGAFKAGDIAWDSITGAITGGSGIVIYKKGIIGATAGAVTFSIDATTGNATFAGDLTGASGTFSGTVSSSSFQLYQNFVAGENITAGRLCCIKGDVETWNNSADATHNTTTIITADTYIDEANANTNYGTEVTMILGSGAMYAQQVLIKINTSEGGIDDWNEVDKVILKLWLRTENMSETATAHLYRITSDWAEGTVTSATAPTYDPYTWVSYDFTTSSQTGYHSFDITELYKLWKKGTYPNYGLMLRFVNAAVGSVTFATDEWTDSGHPYEGRPIVEITSNQNSDGKAYHADYSDYNKVKNFIGIATESKNAGETIKIQGLMEGSYCLGTFTNGRNYYLNGTAGQLGTLAYTSASGYYQRLIGVGKTDRLLIKKETKPILIKSLVYQITDGEGLVQTSLPDIFKIVTPIQCNTIIVKYTFNTDEVANKLFDGELVLYSGIVNDVTGRDSQSYQGNGNLSIMVQWDSTQSASDNGLLTVTSNGDFSSTKKLYGTITIYMFE